MFYRKGELTKARILRDWPHHVLVFVPPGGLGARLDAMHAFCRGTALPERVGDGPWRAGRRPVVLPVAGGCRRVCRPVPLKRALRLGNHSEIALLRVECPARCSPPPKACVAERLSASIIVSHTHGFIFLKTRKTGGSSIEIALRDLCGDIDVITPISEDQTGIPGRGPQNFLFPVMECPEEDRKKWLRGNRSNRILKRLGFFNHFTAAGARARLGEDIWASYFKFSVERNPWDRQVSYYYHGGPKPSHTKPQSFSDFTRNMPPIDNWSTYAIGEQVVVDHIIRYDHDDLQGGLNKALSHIGLTAPPLARAKGAQRPEGQHYRDYFDDDLREFLRGRHRREIEHFGWAF